MTEGPKRSDKDEVLEVAAQNMANAFASLGGQDIKPDDDGQGFMMLCPFHDDSNPSLHVFDLIRGGYKCFAGHCNASGGDIFKFVMDRDGLPFPEAVESVAVCIGASASPGQPQQQPQPTTKKAKDADNDWDWLEEKYEQRRRKLIGNDAVLASIQKMFGVDREAAVTYGLGFQPSFGNNPARVIFPVRNADGKLVNMRKYSSKAVGQGRPKVSNETGYGSPIRLLGVDLLGEHPDLPVLLVAGEKDWLVARHILGDQYVPVSSTGGEGSWRKEFTEALQGRQVTICYDADKAGIKGAEKAGRSLQAGGLTGLRKIKWPEAFVKAFPKGDLADYVLLYDPCSIPLCDLVANAPEASWETLLNAQEHVAAVREGRIPSDAPAPKLRWIERRSKKYFKCKIHKGDLIEEAISDFVIELLFNHAYEDGTRVRELRLVGRRNSEPFMATPEEVTDCRQFRRLIAGRGDYTFDGDQWALNEIWRLEFDEKPCREIQNRSSFGMVDGRFFLGNVAVEDGKVIKAGEDGTVWLANNTGYRAAGGEEPAFGGIVPVVDASLIGKPIPRDEIFKNFGGFWNPPGSDRRWYGELFVGWLCATMFADLVFNEFKCFPVMLFLGNKEAGKTSFIRLALRFWGLDHGGDNFQLTTEFALNRSLSVLSNAPYVLDEFSDRVFKRISPNVVNSIYNRQAGPKGTKTLRTRRFPIRGTLALSGRKRPDADDFLSRLVIIPFSVKRRQEYCWERLKDLEEWLPIITIETVQEGPKDLIEDIQTDMEVLIDSGVPNRKALNYAVAMAGARRLGMLNKADAGEMLSWLTVEMLAQAKQDEEDELVGEFWQMLMYIDDQKWIRQNDTWKHLPNRDALAIHFETVYFSVLKVYRERADRYPIKRSDLLDYLEEGGHLVIEEKDGKKIRTVNVRYKKRLRKSVLLGLNTMPEEVRNFFLDRDDEVGGQGDYTSFRKDLQ